MNSIIDEPSDTININGKQPQRPERALRALGLFGRQDEGYKEREYLKMLLYFIPLAEKPKNQRASLINILTEKMLEEGFFQEYERSRERNPKTRGGLKNAQDFDNATKRVRRLKEQIENFENN